MARTYYATLTAKGQLTLPAEIRHKLDVRMRDKIAFVIDGEDIYIKRPRLRLEDVFNSVPTPEGVDTGDFEALIEDAVREEGERLTREFLGLA